MQIIHKIKISIILGAAFAYPAYASQLVGATENSAALTVQDAPSLSVTLSTSSVVLNVNPTADGQFGRTSMTLDVSTNNTTGYNLTMAADATPLSRSVAVNGETPTIPTLTKSYACTDETATICDNFPNNYWGYKVEGDDNKYLPISTTATSIKTTYSASNSDTTTLYFATKLDNSLPTGNYGTNLTFIATTNYAPSITYMQEMTSEIADQMIEGPIYALKDSRDGVEYNVAKLKDGNIWLLDNLRLNLVTANLSASNTNAPVEALDVLKNGGTTSVPGYTTTAVKESDTGFMSYTAPQMFSGYANRTDNDSAWTYGIHYNYCAATAGTYCYDKDSDSAGGAQYDICPFGWRLPSGVEDYTNLYEVGYGKNAVEFINALHLPSSGGVHGSGATNGFGQGSKGYFWTSDHTSTEYPQTANIMSKDGDAAINANYALWDRYYGIPIRCIYNN